MPTRLPPFNPFKLYSDPTPVGTGGEADDAPQAVSVDLVDVAGGDLAAVGRRRAPVRGGQPAGGRGGRDLRLCRLAADETAAIGEGQAQLLQGAYRPDDGLGITPSPHTTVITKSADDDADDDDEFDQPARRRRDQGLHRRPRRHLDEPVRQGRRRVRAEAAAIIDAFAPDLRERPQAGTRDPLLDGAGALRHRPDGADQGRGSSPRTATSPPWCATGRANMWPRPRQIGNDNQDPAGRDPRHALHRASITPRSSRTFRPIPSSSCCACTPTTSTSSRRSRPATRSRCSSTAGTTR